MGWVNLICYWNGCKLWQSFSEIYFFTDFKCFEDRIRTFPLVGVGDWTLEKLDVLWFIAQHRLTQLWKIFVFQSDCQQFGLLGRSLYFKPCSHFFSACLSLCPTISTFGGLLQCLGWRPKVPKGDFLSFYALNLPYRLGTSHRHQSRSLVSFPAHSQPLVCSCCVLVKIYEKEVAGGADLLCGWSSLRF